MSDLQFKAWLWENRDQFWAQWYIERGWLKDYQPEQQLTLFNGR